MTTREFRLPDLGEGLEDGEIVDWLVEVGETVALNQEIVEVETAKAVIAVPSPYAGTLRERFGEPGDRLDVGDVLCRIEAKTDPTSENLSSLTPDADSPSAEHEEEQAATTGLDAQGEPQPLVGYGDRSTSTRRRRRSARQSPAASASSPRPTAVTVLAKPPVRKLAKDLGVDLTTLAPGNGTEGVITREDVRAAVAPSLEHSETHDLAPNGSPPNVDGMATAGAGSLVGFRGRTPGEVEQVQGIRRRIITKMEQSRREIPHALCSVQVDVTELWEARTPLTEQARSEGHEVKISAFALICRAVVVGLRRFPTLNARYDPAKETIQLLAEMNLGVAVDTERGLMVPNIKDAQSKSTLQLATEVNDLASACREGSITPSDLTGGTFTVNNYGYFGSDDGNPIINHPEAAILGVGAIRQTPWVHDGQVVPRRITTLTLAFDHRVCDGGEAGRFVTYVADLCAQPTRILLHA